jgi:hypothetical protein
VTKASGSGTAGNPSVSTGGAAGPSLDQERANALISAKRAVDKAEAHLQAARQRLADLKKGMN